MKHTPPTFTKAPQPSRPTFGEMLGEVIDLSVGVGVGLLPLLLLAVPGMVLFVVLPAILLLALAVPVVAIGAVIAAPPYLLSRRRQHRRRRIVARSREPLSSRARLRTPRRSF